MAYSDDTIRTKLLARRDALIDEIAALDESKRGGGINIVGAGTVVDHAEYAARLERQLDYVSKQLEKFDGPADEITEVYS